MAVKERLMLCVSSKVSPSAPESATLSEPAKSTKCILPRRSSDTLGEMSVTKTKIKIMIMIIVEERSC